MRKPPVFRPQWLGRDERLWQVVRKGAGMRLVTRLSTVWRALMRPSSPLQAMDEDEPVVGLRRDLAAARLELQEARDALAAERARAAALENAQAAQIRDGIASHLEALFGDLAAPLSQLQMQAALLDAGTAVAASDVMALARRCATVIERAGLEPVGTTGAVIRFDPEVAQPLGTNDQMKPADSVRVRCIGYRYHGRVLRKALVERENS